MLGLDRHRLLAHHVRPGGQRSARLLEVELRRARDDRDIDSGVQHIAVILGRDLEAVLLRDLVQQLRAFAGDGDELDIIVLGEVRKVGRDRPAPGADHADPDLRHGRVLPYLELRRSRSWSNPTAASSSTPRATSCQNELMFMSTRPLFSTPRMSTPSSVPTIVPATAARLAPAEGDGDVADREAPTRSRRSATPRRAARPG